MGEVDREGEVVGVSTPITPLCRPGEGEEKGERESVGVGDKVWVRFGEEVEEGEGVEEVLPTPLPLPLPPPPLLSVIVGEEVEDRVLFKLGVPPPPPPPPLLLGLATPGDPVPGGGEGVRGDLGERVEEDVPSGGVRVWPGIEGALDREGEALVVPPTGGEREGEGDGEGAGRPLPVGLTLPEGPMLGLVMLEEEDKGEALGGLVRDTVTERKGGLEAVGRALEGEGLADSREEPLLLGVAVEVGEEEEEGV